MEVHQVPRMWQRPTSSRSRLFTSLVATAVAAVGFGAFASLASAGTVSAPRGPNGLAFYNPPSNLPSGPHGTLIWQRPAGGLVPLTDAAHTKLVLYTSRTPQGNVEAVSGSVSIPKG